MTTSRIGTLATLALVASCPGYVKLNPADVRTVAVTTISGVNGFCVNGPPPQLKAITVMSNNKQLETWHYERDGSRATEGHLEFGSFTWSSDSGTIRDDGVLQLTADPVTTLDRPITVRVAVVGQPTKVGEVALTPTYDCGAIAELNGEHGRSGSDGRQGSTGSSGSSASSDTSRAGDGGRGGNGGDGGDGGPGGPGLAITAAVGLLNSASGPRAIIRLSRVNGPVLRYYVLEPGRAQLNLVARGGNGGRAGQGGAGGNGGAGGSNSGTGGSGSTGPSGSRGRDGRSGDGGDGGAIVVYYDARHPELAQLVAADTRGGDGGRPGRDGAAPLFQPVDANQLFASELARGIPIAR